jgi:MOSC domain-containing protein YiiM
MDQKTQEGRQMLGMSVFSGTLRAMHDQVHQDLDIDAGLDAVRAAPADDGLVEFIVRRPAHDEREIVGEARLEPDLGLVGDQWDKQDAQSTPSYLAAQLTLISTRVLAAIEPDRARWPLAGDQLYVDLDLSVDNLPAGSRLAIGSAIIEVSETPHTGCAKFSARFGSDALRWINSPVGRVHRMRGMNARILEAGTVRAGDRIKKI